MMNRIRTILLFTVMIVTGIAFTSGSALAKSKKMSLVSVKTTTPIVLDTVAEKAWDKAGVLEVKLGEMPYKPSNGYAGMTETTLRIQSLYDKENIYFLIRWDDPTQSLARFPWVKQGDGSWKQLSNKDDTGHDNTYYEDKMAMFWDINARGFAKKGCDVACHMAENGMNNGMKDTAPGRKYTNKTGETIDMWHWKGVRTNPLGIFDDQFVDNVADPKVNENWGRHGDVKLGGGYKNNVNADKSGPMYMNSPYSEDNKYFVLPWLKAPFVDTFKAGDVVPGIVLDAFTGPRADIKVKGAWQDGHWTLEVKRKLVTKGEKSDVQDVQFKDLKKKYYFGVSVFDNSQIDHLYHTGSIQLTFK
ncbi:MAG: ethylbenzene dehydrogenase-related protein [bacterium]